MSVLYQLQIHSNTAIHLFNNNSTACFGRVGRHQVGEKSQFRFTECTDHGVGIQYKSVTASCRDWQHRYLVLVNPWVHVSATQALILDDFLSPDRIRIIVLNSATTASIPILPHSLLPDHCTNGR
jgi:hypothetical protein